MSVHGFKLAERKVLAQRYAVFCSPDDTFVYRRGNGAHIIP